MTRPDHSRVWAVGSLAAVMMVFACVLARPASAQLVSPDARWTAWLGCWTPDTGAATRTSDWTKGAHVCAIPSTTASAIDIVRIADNKMVSREHVNADGARHPSIDTGCAGWQQATWSADGQRLFVRGESVCGDGKKGTSAGIVGFTTSGDWIDVMGITSGLDTGVRTVRYRPGFGLSGALPPGIVSELQANAAAIEKARAVVASAVNVPDVIEAGHHLDSPATQAWLIANGQPFDLNARRLGELADARVPDSVIDVVVALSFPQTFSLMASRAVRVNATTSARIRGGGGGGDNDLADCMWMGGLTYLHQIDRCGWNQAYWWGNPAGPFSSVCLPSGTANSWLRCSYGYWSPNGSPFTYGYPYGYPNGYRLAAETWYVGQEPFVIVNGGGASTTPVGHGRVVNGLGYTQGSRVESGASSSSSSPAPSAPATPASSGSSDGGSSAPPPPSSGGGERTAHPR